MTDLLAELSFAKEKFRETGPSCQTAETLSVGPTVAFIVPLLSDPAKPALSTAYSQGAESADAANSDGNRCALGEQIAFQEIVR